MRSSSNPKTPNGLVVMVPLLSIDHALDGAELLHVARNCDGTLLIKSKLFLSLLQQLHEEGMVDVDHRYNEPFLLLTLTHQDCQTTLWDVFQFILLMLPVVVVVKVGLLLLLLVKVEVRHVNMEIQVVSVYTNRHKNQEKESLKYFCTEKARLTEYIGFCGN